MTVKKLKAANELLARIEKAKESKAILENENSILSITTESASVTMDDGEIKAKFIETVNSLIKELEHDFEYFDVYYREDE